MPTQQQRSDINCCLASGHCSETAAAARKHTAEVCKKSGPQVVCSKALSLRYDLVFVRKYFHRIRSFTTLSIYHTHLPTSMLPSHVACEDCLWSRKVKKSMQWGGGGRGMEQREMERWECPIRQMCSGCGLQLCPALLHYTAAARSYLHAEDSSLEFINFDKEFCFRCWSHQSEQKMVKK